MRTSSGSLLWLFVLCLQTSALGRSIKGLKSRAPPNDALIQQWRDASWIWLSDGLDLEVPSGDWVFRTTYSPRSGVSVRTANVLITADDYFTLFVNGQEIGGTRSPANEGQTVWATAQGYSITVNNAPVTFAVIATNRGDPSGTAAGLLFAAQLTLSDGSAASVSTGRNNWRATQGIPQNFEATNINDSGWSSTAIIEKNAGNAPWGIVSLPSDLTGVSLPAQAPPPSPNTSPSTPTTNAVPGPNPPISQTTIRNVETSVAIVTGTNGRLSTSTSTSTRTAVSVLDGTTGVAPPPIFATTTGSTTGTATLDTSSSATAAIATSSSSSTSTTPVGAIAGGTVGGFICLLLLIAAIILYLRGRRRNAEALAALHADEMRTAATMSPSSGTPFSSAPSPTPFAPNRRLEPFMLQARNDSGLRSKMHHDQKTSDEIGTHERSLSSSSGATRATGEIGVTMDRLQELAEELNRGLAERGEDGPRLMVVSARDAEMMNSQPAIGSVQDRMRDSVPLPPYEGRQEP